MLFFVIFVSGFLGSFIVYQLKGYSIQDNVKHSFLWMWYYAKELWTIGSAFVDGFKEAYRGHY